MQSLRLVKIRNTLDTNIDIDEIFTANSLINKLHLENQLRQNNIYIFLYN